MKKIWTPSQWTLKGKILFLSLTSAALGIIFTLGALFMAPSLGFAAYLLAAVVALFLAGILAHLVFSHISESVKSLTHSIQTMKILEEGKSWLEKISEDEIGCLAKEVTSMIDRLKEENEQNIKLIAAITEAVDKLSEYSSNILAISHEQATGASEQATAIQEAFTTSKEIAVTSKEIAANAVSVTGVAGNADSACKEGNDRVITAIKGMEEVKKQVSSLAEKMLELGKSNQKIGKVVDIIDEISERTNLLALNAAIEAAGAGSRGKRFGIVASEIRRLAEKTAEATLQIKGLINSMQEVTNATIMSTEQAIHAVGESFQLVQNVGEALKNIGDLVQKTSKAAKEISFSTQQQTSASEQMSVAIAEVNQVAEHFVRGSEETAQAIEELNELTRQLQELVSFQKTGV
ncbi:MAG: methyl-accepting chemotaxis protein [Planctomycetota bacterium]|nr:MAG: methyl-accepting chemotaxis protein [Planctomycetota bacterium]